MTTSIEETEANIKILKRFIDDFNALIETMIEDFDANDLQMENLRTHLNEVKENLDMSKEVLSELQAVRNMFPYHHSLCPQEYFEHLQNQVQVELPEHSDQIEESRPFPNAWPSE